MIDLKTMIQQLRGLINNVGISTWENYFITDVVERSQCGEIAATLNDKQVAAVQRLFAKYFND